MVDWRLILLSASLLLAMPDAWAKKYYKWQDDNGVWHYSDKKPDEDVEVEARHVKVEAQNKVKLIKRGLKQSPRFVAMNYFHGPVELTVEMIDGFNVKTDPSLPFKTILDGYGEHNLFSLGAAGDGSWSYQLSYNYVPGQPVSPAGFMETYRLPFPEGESYLVSQSFGGVFSHQDDANKFAVDIAMPVGTAIVAARDGVVMDVERDFKGNGTKAYYLERANQVRVLHDDRCMAVYGHLKLESIQVRPGQKIQAGDKIAESGNTGFSSGPHLHYVVQCNVGGRIVSVPFQFKTAAGILPPERGMILQ